MTLVLYFCGTLLGLAGLLAAIATALRLAIRGAVALSHAAPICAANVHHTVQAYRSARRDHKPVNAPADRRVPILWPRARAA